MDKRKRPRDINQRAASTVAIATGQEVESEITDTAEATPEERHDAAVMLGSKGGQSRAKNLTPEQRSEIAKKAARARWAQSHSTE